MEKIFSNKLKIGDEVRVIAPALSMAVITEETRENANKVFKKMGLKLSFGKHVESKDLFRSSSIKERIDDLHEAFSDSKIKAVTSVIGGYNCNQLLKYIDWELIAKNPKIFCGFSDVTVLNNAIFAKTGLVNYSGPAYSSFGNRLAEEYNIDYYKQCLFDNNPLEIKESEKWDDRKWWENQEDRTLLNNPGWKIINEGEAIGTILGGNLCTFNLLQGTEYMPNLSGSVLFLEEDGMAKEYTAVEFDRNLQSLIHQPGFEEVLGILIGRFQKVSNITDDILREIIGSKKELAKIPVVSGIDFGHTDPKITFPIGGEVSLEAKHENIKIIINKH